MAIDLSNFHLLNVADTCSIWNILSSLRFYQAAREANCSFCCTDFVLYECLRKRRSERTPEDDELMSRLSKEHDSYTILSCSLDIEDLQDVAVLESRRKLSKGELSSIVFAKKTNQAFLTDDQKARKLGETELATQMVQTTPHLFGWLFYTGALIDGDKDSIIDEHESQKRPLRQFLETMYMEAMRCRLMSRNSEEI